MWDDDNLRNHPRSPFICLDHVTVILGQKLHRNLQRISLEGLQLLNFSVLLSFLEFVLKKLLMNAVCNTKASFGLASHFAS